MNLPPRVLAVLGVCLISGCQGVQWDQSDQVAKRIIGVFPTTKLAIAGDYKYHPEYLVGSIACVYSNDDIARLADVPNISRPSPQTVTELSTTDPSKGLMASGYATASAGAAIQAAVAGGSIDLKSAWSYEIRDVSASILPQAIPQASVSQVLATLDAQQVSADCELVAISGVALVYLHSQEMNSIDANAKSVVGPAIGFGGSVYAKGEQGRENYAWFIRVAKQPVARPAGAPAYVQPSASPAPNLGVNASLVPTLGQTAAMENAGPFAIRLTNNRLPEVKSGPSVRLPPVQELKMFH
nr:hypothetical protein [uncultured Rhodopila sp.]